jgi:uncharacterized membrane protein
VNIAVWVTQGVLALVFLQSGVRKLLRSEAQTRAVYWVGDTPTAAVRGLGVLELLGAAGLILPGLTSVLTWLTPLAALGLVGLMLGAAGVNARLRRYPLVAANLSLLALAAFVIVGRLVLAPA